MASYNNINDLKKIIYLILFGLPVIASMDIDCNGKPFHCVNSTHFMICVDLGGGVSQTIDNFLISCPPTTECRGTNHFECEYVRLTPTMQPVQSSSVKNDIIENVQVDWEKIDVTTTMPGYRTSDLELSEKYFNGLSIPTIPILISTTSVNTNEGTTEELHKNDNNISVVTTPSYFKASTDTIVTTATLRPRPELTPESTTKPKVAAEAYTESVGFPVTEIYLKSSDVDEIKESSKTPDGTLDVTEKSTLFEVFTLDTPFHVEYSPSFQLDSVIETKTSRTTINSTNVSERYETNTTLVATTVPDTTLDLTTPKSDITESEKNLPKPTIILENINLTNLEINKEILLNSTGSSVITVAQTPNNLNSSGSENVDSTTTNFVFDRYSTVNNTVDRSVVNKTEKISAEQAPAYTIPYPAEEPLTDNIIFNSVAADFLYFENSTSETPIFATTSEMVSDNQNESIVTSDSTHDSSFTDSQNQDNINHTSEGTWVAKESSPNTVLLSNASSSLINTELTNNTNTFVNRPLVSTISKETEFNVTKHNNFFFPNNINITEELLNNTVQLTTLSFDMNKDSEGTKHKKPSNTKVHPKLLKIKEQLSNQSFATGIETTDQNVAFGFNNQVNNSLNTLTQSVTPNVYPNAEKSHIYSNSSRSDISPENFNPNITLNDVDTGKNVNVNFTLFDKSLKIHFTTNVMTDESPSSPPPSDPELTVSISTPEDTVISSVIQPLILTTPNPESEFLLSTATEATNYYPLHISSSTKNPPTAIDLTSQEKSKPIPILNPKKSSDLLDATASILTDQVLYDSHVVPGSVSFPYSTITTTEVIATTPVIIQQDDSDSLFLLPTQNIVSSQSDARQSLTSLDEDYISSIGPYSTAITQKPINSYIPTGPLYRSVDPFSISKQQTMFNLPNHDNTDSNPSVTILPILNSHTSSQPFITKVHNEEDYNTIVTPSTLNPHPARPFTNYNDDFNPSVGLSSTLKIPTSDSQIPVSLIANFHDNSNPTFLQSTTHTISSSSLTTGPPTNYQVDIYPAAVQSLTLKNDTSNSLIPQSLGTNLLDNFRPLIVQSSTSNPNSSNSQISASQVTNLEDHSLPSIVELTISNPHTATSSSVTAESLTYYQEDSNLSVQFSTSNPDISNSRKGEEKNPESPVTNLQDNSFTSIVQSSTSNPYTSYSQMPASPGTSFQDNFNPSIVQFATSNQQSYNSQISKKSGIYLLDNSNPPIEQSPTLNTHTSDSQIPKSPVTNIQANSKASILQYFTSNPYPSNSHISESPYTNHQDTSMVFIEESSISNPRSDTPSVDEGPITNNQLNLDPAVAQTSTLNTHNSNSQIPETPVTNIQENPNPSLVESSTLDPYTSYSEILAGLGTDLQDSFQASNSNPPTATSSLVPAKPLTNYHKDSNLSVIQSSTIIKPHTSNSQIPESLVTKHQDNYIPSIVESSISNSHITHPSVDIGPTTNNQENINPAIAQILTLNTHTSNSQILASPDTRLQDNTNPSVVQATTSNPHNPSSQIPASSGTNLQDNFNPSIVQSATSNPHNPSSQIPASSGTNLQDNFNPSIVQFATSNPHTSNSQIPESSITHLLDNSNPSIAQSSTLITHTTTAQFPASKVANLQDNYVPFFVHSSISNLHTASSEVDTGPPANKQEHFNPSVVQTSTTNLHSSNSQIPALQVKKIQDNSTPYIMQSSTLNHHTSNSQITASPVINLQEDSITFVLPTTSSNLNITPIPKDSSPSLPTASTSIKQLGFNPSPHTESNLNASAKPFPTQQNNSKTIVVQSLISNQPTYSTPILTLPDKHNKDNNNPTVTLSTSNPVVISKPVVTIPILSPHNLSQEEEQPQTPTFTCVKKYRGRYADNKDCRKFYICIGIGKPIAGVCPANTVFSEERKQCTKNLSHCVRENEFQCVSEGRFGDVSKNNIYYICIRNSEATYVRFKFQCQLGYHLNKTTVKCTENVITPKSRVSASSSIESSSKVESEVVSVPERKNSIEIPSNKDKREFECESEGKFAHPSDCRKYFVCKKKKSEFRRKSKKCDSDEVFHKEKKKCVDADSYAG